jgi:two-component system, NarL family, nitrate/nitrite response regulator NarL
MGGNELAREGLKRILTDTGVNVNCVAAAEHLVQFESKLANNDPSHIVLCLIANDSEAVTTTRELRQSLPKARIVAMVDEFSLDNVAAAFEEGVDGYVVSEIGCQSLFGVLQLTALGEKVFPSQLAPMLTASVWKLLATNWKFSNDFSLSEREIEILRCLANGDCNKVIARRLEITEATVKVHVKAVLRKMRVSNRTQAAIWAITRGLSHREPPMPAPPGFQHMSASHVHTRVPMPAAL